MASRALESPTMREDSPASSHGRSVQSFMNFRRGAYASQCALLGLGRKSLLLSWVHVVINVANIGPRPPLKQRSEPTSPSRARAQELVLVTRPTNSNCPRTPNLLDGVRFWDFGSLCNSRPSSIEIQASIRFVFDARRSSCCCCRQQALVIGRWQERAAVHSRTSFSPATSARRRRRVERQEGALRRLRPAMSLFNLRVSRHSFSSIPRTTLGSPTDFVQVSQRLSAGRRTGTRGFCSHIVLRFLWSVLLRLSRVYLVYLLWFPQAPPQLAAPGLRASQPDRPLGVVQVQSFQAT